MTIGIVKRFLNVGFGKDFGERQTGVKMNRTKDRGKWPCHSLQNFVRRHEVRPRLMFSHARSGTASMSTVYARDGKKSRPIFFRPRSEERDALNVCT